MGLYNKPVLDLLYDLINRDNPGLMTPLSSKNTLLLGGPFTTNLGSSGRTTRATFNAIVGKGYTGDLEVFYDRINLAYLFNNQIPKVTVPYLATSRAQMLPAINAALGLALTENDINIPNNTVTASTVASGSVTIGIAATCLAFTGSLTVNYVRELPRLIDVYTSSKNSLSGMWTNYAFTGKIHNRSWQPFLTTLNGVVRNAALTSSSTGAAAFVALLNNTTGLKFTIGTTLPVAPDDLDITGAVMSYVQARGLPDSNPRYQNVFVLTPIPGRHKWTRPIYFHVTPRFTESSEMVYDDLLRFMEANVQSRLGSQYGLSSQADMLVGVHLGGAVEGAWMDGTPWGSYFRITSWASRVAQHSMGDQASYDYAVENDLYVLLQLAPLSNIVAMTALTRNGYTSRAATISQNQSCAVTKCIYVDAASKTVKFTVPATSKGAAIWTP